MKNTENKDYKKKNNSNNKKNLTNPQDLLDNIK